MLYKWENKQNKNNWILVHKDEINEEIKINVVLS